MLSLESTYPPAYQLALDMLKVRVRPGFTTSHLEFALNFFFHCSLIFRDLAQPMRKLLRSFFLSAR